MNFVRLCYVLEAESIPCGPICIVENSNSAQLGLLQIKSKVDETKLWCPWEFRNFVTASHSVYGSHTTSRESLLLEQNWVERIAVLHESCLAWQLYIYIHLNTSTCFFCPFHLYPFVYTFFSLTGVYAPGILFSFSGRIKSKTVETAALSYLLKETDNRQQGSLS